LFSMFPLIYSGVFACVSQNALFFPSLCRFLYSPVQICAVMFRNSLKMLLGGKSNRKNRNSGRLSFNIESFPRTTRTQGCAFSVSCEVVICNHVRVCLLDVFLCYRQLCSSLIFIRSYLSDGYCIL